MLKIWMFAVLLAIPLVEELCAQTVTASVSGVVTDGTGATVSGANISAQNVATGVVSKAVSNDRGVYLFASLPQGRYRISSEKEGFQKLTYEDIVLEVASRLNLNFPMEIGSVQSVVEVKADSENILGYATSSVGNVISGARILSLPNLTRNALGFISLQAGVNGSNFAGSRVGMQSITLDGINVQDAFINTGNFSTTKITVDRVEEIRVISSPADAEYGRGSGQVQMITPSGGNEFHGGVFYFHRNTIFNSNPWFNNARGLNPRTGQPISPRQTFLRNQFGGKLGGPVRKNKTFFFFLYDAQRERTKTAVTSRVYTPTARQGIFRFFPGVLNGNADALNPTVDLNGNAVRPANAGELQSVNLFQADAFRTRLDPTGTAGRLLNGMPAPNNFRTGDGLNTAGYTWNRSATNDIDQFTGKIDHNFNDRQRLTVNFTKERQDVINAWMQQPFPDSPGGNLEVPNMSYSFNLTSTLRSNLTNEFRGGGQRAKIRFLAPWERSGDSSLPQLNGTAFLPVFAGVTDPIDNTNDPQGRIAPVYQYADNITWVKGKHQWKAGVELRFASANSFSSFGVVPRANFGSGVVPNIGVQGIPSIGANSALAISLLNDLSGTLANATQTFNASGVNNPQFLPGLNYNRVWRQREWMFFLKDDFKVTRHLTLNLGVRYEYFGTPNERSGYMQGLVGGGNAIFGPSGNSFGAMYRPGLAEGSLTRVELVGKGSPNPSRQIYGRDSNNWAPAVGITYALPNWLGLTGDRRTVIRTGYSIAYERLAFGNLENFSALPGMQSSNTFRSGALLSLANLSLPLQPVGAPLSAIPLTDRAQTMLAYDPNLRNPYVQNFNFSIQRQLPGQMTIDVRYVGSKGTRLLRASNVNEINIFESGLLDAYRVASTGGHSPLLNSMFLGLNIAGLGRIDGVNLTGTDAVRAFQAANIANQAVATVGDFLNRTTVAGAPGELLRRAGLPENQFVVSPQFVSALYLSNFANSTYHSMQMEVQKRFGHGLTFQSNWTWSRTLGEEDGGSQSFLASYRDGRNRRLDRRLLGFHLTHIVRNSATYELPFGRNQRFLSGAGKVLDKVVGGWQINGIFNNFTGQALTVTSNRASWNQFANFQTPYVPGPVDGGMGHAQRTGNGVVYFQGLSSVPDPSRAGLTTLFNIRQASGLFAIQDAGGRILFQNPVAGTLGNLMPAFLYGPGSFRFDMNVRKIFRFGERKEFIVQADATDVTNTPQWGNPTLDINSPNFGRITTATGNRLMIIGARVNF
ncbi:MAG: carboxypeptidase regulatory-like domain-containing protein [Bryobacterales bacterium]|nr:carboxypeptidase regulatory-like domain-containing protein [Bryobacterales bacterium]